MQVKELQIKRTESYEEPPRTIVGVVKVSNEYGEQTIRLSATTLAKIFDVIKQDASRTAQSNAGMVAKAIEDAAAEGYLLDQSANIAIQG